MSKARLEAFSDGVLAILITIMVLNFHLPSSAALDSLAPLLPSFLGYLMSFVFLGIYWSNHHHMLQAVKHVDGRVLWANLHLLFWLSLVPSTTAWMGNTHFEVWPVAVYGIDLLFASVAYFVLAHSLISLHGRESALATALGEDFKGKISVGIYALSIPLAFVNPLISCLLYVIVSVMWLVPDRRIEKVLAG